MTQAPVAPTEERDQKAVRSDYSYQITIARHGGTQKVAIQGLGGKGKTLAQGRQKLAMLLQRALEVAQNTSATAFIKRGEIRVESSDSMVEEGDKLVVKLGAGSQ